MKKIIKPTIYLVLFLCLNTILLQTNLTKEYYQGATSYTNAKEFYESTATNGQSFHAEVVNGTIYYATCAKLADSNSNLCYETIGFDIELFGNQHRLSFTVERLNGSMKQVGEAVQSNGYEYILYTIDSATIFDLATKSNSFEADYVLDASIITVNMDAILITKKDSNPSGGISEDGKGGFTQWGTIYRLNNKTDLDSLKIIFQGHSFKSYYGIKSDLSNNELHLRYHLQGLNSSSSTQAIVNNLYTIQDGFLFENNQLYIQKQKILQQTFLLNPNTIALEKEGYHLVTGKEWITNDRRTFSFHTAYMPAEIDPIIQTGNHGITLYANWEPNTYTISYHANGGIGTVPSSTFTFDCYETLRANNFSKTGYYLENGAEWNTKADGSGTSYGSEQLVTNLSSEINGELILYSNWKPILVSIDTEKNGGSGGTDTFYQIYGVDFYSDWSLASNIHRLSLPKRIGYSFEGYYQTPIPTGTKLINTSGDICVPNTYFLKHAIIYADYSPNTYTIFFDKQGGTGGTDCVYPLYDELLPYAEAPYKTGARFKGYYTQPHGQGILYYNEFMASDYIYKTDGDTTLYAYWVDETPPDTFLIANFNTWTNHSILLTATAFDYDSGLDSIQLYQDNQLVAEYKNLNGQMKKTVTYQNLKEGVQNYRMIATDKIGNKNETNRTIFYDKKAPQGTIAHHTENGSILSITIYVTDINVP